MEHQFHSIEVLCQKKFCDQTYLSLKKKEGVALYVRWKLHDFQEPQCTYVRY